MLPVWTHLFVWSSTLSHRLKVSSCSARGILYFFFFLNDRATPEISPFPLPDALPICTPSPAATTPATTSRPSCRVVRQPSPPTRRTLPDTADRCEARGEAGRPERATTMGTREPRTEDRKSTRLNSSH